MSKCKQCGVEFESKRSTAQFCTSKCRVAFNRVSVTNSVTPLSVTSPSVTPQRTAAARKLDTMPVQVFRAMTPMVKAELFTKAGRTSSAKPGDPGYAGCCVETDGEWIAPSQVNYSNPVGI